MAALPLFCRRSISKGVCFTCPFTRNCTITKAKRRQCQACRLQKCLAVGMKKDMIMSEEALQMRRVLRKQKKQERELAEEPAELTEEQEQLISSLIEAHKRHFDSGFSQFVHCRVRVPTPSLQGDMLPDNFSMLPHFADLSTVLIQQVIKFAKEIPAFRSLPIDDQISLLKGATLEICQIQFNTVFNEETKAWECGQHCYTIQDGALGESLWPGFQQIYLEPLLKFHISLKKLRLHEAEYVLLLAIALFSPGELSPGPSGAGVGSHAQLWSLSPGSQSPSCSPRTRRTLTPL
uniref:Nuclear receptor subfamily 1 group I member 3 n=1 Tax=Chrysemys picta bellii TaxID=8478 RepID=A0A8C3FRA7_CHRPI